MTTETKPPCIDGTQAHAWAIETPHGPYSHGVCKRCGLEHSFPTWDAEATLWTQDEKGKARAIGAKAALKAQQEIRLPGSRERRTV